MTRIFFGSVALATLIASPVVMLATVLMAAGV